MSQVDRMVKTNNSDDQVIMEAVDQVCALCTRLINEINSQSSVVSGAQTSSLK
jgi:hypothetical protein